MAGFLNLVLHRSNNHNICDRLCYKSCFPNPVRYHLATAHCVSVESDLITAQLENIQCDFMSALPCLCTCPDPAKGRRLRQHEHHLPPNQPHHNCNNCHYHNPHGAPQQQQYSYYENVSCQGNPPQICHPYRDAPNAPNASVPQPVGPRKDTMHEVSVNCPYQPGPGPATREIRKTISLPEECSKLHQCLCVNILYACKLYSWL